MTPENFVYWLQGLIENNESDNLTKGQYKSVKEHLSKVFTYIPPKVQTIEKIIKDTKKSEPWKLPNDWPPYPTITW